MELLMMILVFSCLALLGISLLSTMIRLVALQGILLGIFTLLTHSGELTVRLYILAGLTVFFKGFVYPFLLRRAMKETGIQREIEPFVGFSLSIFIGIAMLGFSLWLGSRLNLQAASGLALVLPASIMTLLTGLFLAIARKKAITQCLGYLVLENGIYAFGIVAVGQIPVLLELGMLLDAFVAVFVMGIAIYRINREFDHIDADQLSSLKG